MITLDTHVIVWDALKPEMLSPMAKAEIAKANKRDGIIFCEVSLLEIALMLENGKISISVGYEALIDLILKSNKYQLTGMTAEIAAFAAGLKSDSGANLIDNIIAATAIIKNAKLVTADDRLLAATEIPTIW